MDHDDHREEGELSEEGELPEESGNDATPAAEVRSQGRVLHLLQYKAVLQVS